MEYPVFFMFLMLRVNSFHFPIYFLKNSKQHNQRELLLSSKTNLDILANKLDEAKITWDKVVLSNPIESSGYLYMSDDDDSVSASHQSALNILENLKGRYIINGLGSCKIGEQLVHPFEAHGFIKSIEFCGNNTIKTTAKYIQTMCTNVERKVNRPLWRGVMSTAFTGYLSFLNMFSSQDRNTANLACRYWPLNNNNNNQIIIVGGDNGEPYYLDAKTLKTVGKLSDHPGFECIAGKKFLAHTRYDPIRDTLVMCHLNMMVEYGKFPLNMKCQLEFFEFDKNFQLVSQTPYTTDDFIVMHDWTITDNYYVVPQNPAKMLWGNLFQFLIGLKRGVDVFRTDEDKKGSILLIPRHYKGDPINFPKQVIQASAETFFNIFHMGPVYETEENILTNTQKITEDLTQTMSTNQNILPNKNNKQIIMYGVVFDSYTFGNEMGFNITSQTFHPTEWSSPTSKMTSPPRLDKFIIELSEAEPKPESQSQSLKPSSNLHSILNSDNHDKIKLSHTKTTGKIISRTRVPLISKSKFEDSSYSVPQIVDIPCDMPTYGLHSDTLKCRYIYFTGGKQDGWFPFRYVVKTDLENNETQSWYAGDGKIVSEPIFVPITDINDVITKSNGQNNDNGYVLSMLCNSINERSELAIFDAKNITKGPVALLNLGQLSPWNVHGYFLPDYKSKN